ncbi:MAG: hypothetical protein R3B40_12870 [Polyangiales bacterium]
MNRAIQRVKAELQAFVDQRDDFVQVIHALDTEFAIILSALQAVEDETPSDIFLSFAVPCTGLDAYLESIFVRANLCIDRANEELAEEGFPPLAGLPEICGDASATVFERLKAMVEHFRQLAGDPLDRHLVIAFLPLEIADRSAYATIVSGFFPRAGHEHWMRGVRVFVRDDASNPFVLPFLRREGIGDIRVLDANLSPQALLDGISEATADPETPMPERMAGMVQLASMDLAQRNYPDAVKKFRAAYGHFTQTGNVSMRALCLHGMGLAAERGGRPEDAKTLFMQGIGLAATEAHALPVTLLLASSLGDVCHALRQHDDALGYYDLAEKLATGLGNLAVRIEASLKQGDVKVDTGRTGEALAHWIAASDLSREFSMFALWGNALDRRQRIAKRDGMREQSDAVTRERALMAAMERRMSA